MKGSKKNLNIFVMISLNIGVVLNTTIIFCSTIFVHRQPQCVAAMYNVVASESQSCSGKRNTPYLRRVLPVNIFFPPRSSSTNEFWVKNLMQFPTTKPQLRVLSPQSFSQNKNPTSLINCSVRFSRVNYLSKTKGRRKSNGKCGSEMIQIVSFCHLSPTSLDLLFPLKFIREHCLQCSHQHYHPTLKKLGGRHLFSCLRQSLGCRVFS